MYTCPLTKGLFALCDLNDAPKVNQYKWYAEWCRFTQSYYAVTKPWDPILKKSPYKIYMHRLILDLDKGDQHQVDHMSHDTLDNRRLNLRIVNNSLNQHNKRGVKGYTKPKGRNKWLAQIRINGKYRYLGWHDTEAAAREAYLKAKQDYGLSISK